MADDLISAYGVVPNITLTSFM